MCGSLLSLFPPASLRAGNCACVRNPARKLARRKAATNCRTQSSARPNRRWGALGTAIIRKPCSGGVEQAQETESSISWLALVERRDAPPIRSRAQSHGGEPNRLLGLTVKLHPHPVGMIPSMTSPSEVSLLQVRRPRAYPVPGFLLPQVSDIFTWTSCVAPRNHSKSVLCRTVGESGPTFRTKQPSRHSSIL